MEVCRCPLLSIAGSHSLGCMCSCVGAPEESTVCMGSHEMHALHSWWLSNSSKLITGISRQRGRVGCYISINGCGEILWALVRWS